MLVLGIESSCDDTSVALVECSDKGFLVISEKTASQIEIHKKYGGVVPEIAGRMHAEKIVPLIEEVLANPPPPASLREALRAGPPRPSGESLRPDVIAVTAGPGLITGLIVGVEAARTLSYAWDIPLVAVNHIEGHIYSVEINQSAVILSETKDPSPITARDSSVASLPQNDNRDIQYPALALVVSGGHTELILMPEQGKYEILGRTKDDAAGECFDKVAKLLDLPYPGGPEISKLAESGNVAAIDFPRPMIRESNFDFSFSGLKTSALYWLRDNHLNTVIPSDAASGQALSEAKDPSSPTKRDSSVAATLTQNDNNGTNIYDFCASFEQAIVDVLVTKTLRAAEKYRPKTIILAGGVSANKKLREVLGLTIKQSSIISNFQFPISNYCMDNAAMIAVAGYYHALRNDFTSWEKITADPNWKIA